MPVKRLVTSILILTALYVLCVYIFVLSGYTLDQLSRLVAVLCGAPALLGPAIAIWINNSESRTATEEYLPKALNNLAGEVFDQWQPEWKQHRNKKFPSLPVRWSSTDGKEIHSLPARIGWATAANDAEMPCSNGKRSDMPARLADVFQQLPHRRLIIFGESGSGKTMIALRLTLDLLADRGATDPVPILLSLARWNPVGPEAGSKLRVWIATRLLDEYKRLDRAIYDTTVASELVRQRQTLPILDGFDEMAPTLQKDALDDILRTLAERDQLIITSRREKLDPKIYESLLEAVDPATVMEIQPMKYDDEFWEFMTGNPRDSLPSRWLQVARHIEESPDGPLAACLATPLMAWLAQKIFEQPSGDQAKEPAQLTAIESQDAIESLLLRQLVPVVFSDGYKRAGGSGETSYRNPLKVERWLNFLAKHLEGEETEDIAWWRLRRAARFRQLEVVFGLVAGLVFAPILNLLGSKAAGFIFGPILGLLFGAAFGVSYTAIRKNSRGGSAGGFRPAPTLADLRRRLHCGLITVIIAWAIAVLVLVLMRLAGLVSDLSVPELSSGPVALGLLAGVALALVFGLLVGSVAGFALGGLEDLEAKVATVTASTPLETLERDRRANIFVGVMFIIAVGVTTGVSTLLAFAGQPEYGAWGVIGGGVVGGICATMMFFAWAPYVPARVWLAVRRKLPWRLMTFLDIAHGRGVLRQFGANYQFRHRRLREVYEAWSPPPGL